MTNVLTLALNNEFINSFENSKFPFHDFSVALFILAIKLSLIISAGTEFLRPTALTSCVVFPHNQFPDVIILAFEQVESILYLSSIKT